MQALSTKELLDFCTGETRRWREWFNGDPALLDFSIDIAKAKNVRELVLHIVAVELRYSERLLEEKVTEYSEIDTSTVEKLFAAADRAANNLRAFMAKADEAEWAKVMSFPTITAGTLTASKRKIFVHALLHGMRHWAQLATWLRQHDHKAPWQHDFLFSDAIP